MKTIEHKPEDTRERVTILRKQDLQFSYFCGSGAGGQARNKVHSGCQIRHEDSGAIGRASDSRSLEENKRSAFQRLLKDPRMKFWLARKIYEVRQGEALEKTIERDASPENCKFEIQRDGKWVEVPDGHFDTVEAKQLT